MINKIVVTKDNLINAILDKCKTDFISTEELFKIIDKASDEDGIITKKTLIKYISRGSHTKNVIKDIYNILEDLIFEFLSNVNKRQNVCIKLFEGISLNGVYTPEKMKTNNLTGESNLVSSKIKPKFSITRSYCEKLNDK